MACNYILHNFAADFMISVVIVCWWSNNF